jgi:hypothetical protein
VLQQANVSANCQLLIDFNSGDGRQATVVWSPYDGFSGGDTSNRPTAADQKSFGVIDLFWETNTGGFGFPNRAHVQMSDDGKCTRIFFCCSKEVRSWILVDVPENAPVGWTDPAVAICTGYTGQAGANANMGYTHWGQSMTVKAEGPVGDMPMFLVFKGFATSGTDNGTIVGYDAWGHHNELDDDDPDNWVYPMNHVGIVCRNNEGLMGQRGHHGYLADMYSTARGVSNGNSFPGDGTKSWINFGQFAWPWNGDDIEMP